MQTALEQIEVMLERGANDAQIEGFIAAQHHLSGDEKDVLVWTASGQRPSLSWAVASQNEPHSGNISPGRDPA